MTQTPPPIIKTPPLHKPLKVLHLSTSDTGGGAAIAAHRLCKAQRNAGIEANMLVLTKKSDDPFVYKAIDNSILNNILPPLFYCGELAFAAVANALKTDYRLFELSFPFLGVSIANHPLVLNADVLHFHWTNQGFLSLRSLKELIPYQKKIVFTLHDIWPVSAVCHYSMKSDYPFFEKDTRNSNTDIAKYWANKIYERKKEIYRQLRPSFVGCSQWIANIARRSRLAQGCLISAIPNIPDTLHFAPHEKMEAREKLGLPKNRPIILFGAANAKDPRKGYQYLVMALQKLAQNPDIAAMNPLLVVFGKADASDFNSAVFKLDTCLMGFIANAEIMALLYSAANVFVIPSIEENFPNTIIEAQLCECPSVGFRIGGIPEIVDTPAKGTLVNPYDIVALSDAIAAYLQHEDQFDLRGDAIRRYTASDIVAQYSKVYNSNGH